MVEKPRWHFMPAAVILLCCCMQSLAQPAPLQWTLKYGGSQVDIPLSIQPAADGGTIVTGYTDSKDGDIQPVPGRDYWDLWVVKLNACGIIEWERSFGGSNYEAGHDVLQTADGGYLVAGETNSTDGGVVSGYGGTKDIWLLKLAADGSLLWQKRYGGNGLDIANCIHPAPDGGFYIAASSSSNNGDITGNHGTAGYTDGVLMKIDAAGTLLWSKCFGGSKNEELLSIVINNGRMFLAGYANSIDGDIPPNQKNYDVWLLALDMNGNRVFSKIYGGSQNDVAYSMTPGDDGSLTLAGYTTSTDGDVSGAKGGQDYWVINITAEGNLRWQQTLGGSDADYANTVITDTDGGYLVGGISYSSDADVTNAKGDGDYWLVKINAAGSVLWKQNLGGSGSDHLRRMAYSRVHNAYYLAGDSESGDGDANAAGRGETDFWIVKLRMPQLVTADTSVCSTGAFVPYTDTLTDQCGFDSAWVTYRPVLINGPFTGINRADSVFEGQSLQLPFTGNATASWAGHSTLSCTQCPNPVATPLVTTTYTATNALDSCRVTDNYTVVVLKDAVVNIPGAFSPNGDGVNDEFGPIGKVPDEYAIRIFNRFGQLVFESKKIPYKWDGRTGGKPVPPGTFVYDVQYKDIQQQIRRRKGTVLLLR